MIILPRQARDKHRESTEREMRFSHRRLLAGTMSTTEHPDDLLEPGKASKQRPDLTWSDLSDWSSPKQRCASCHKASMADPSLCLELILMKMELNWLWCATCQ
jgi:hypothetical protein